MPRSFKFWQSHLLYFFLLLPVLLASYQKLLSNPPSPLLLMNDFATFFTEKLCLQLPYHSQASLSQWEGSLPIHCRPLPWRKRTDADGQGRGEIADQRGSGQQWSAVAGGKPLPWASKWSDGASTQHSSFPGEVWLLLFLPLLLLSSLLLRLLGSWSF